MEIEKSEDGWVTLIQVCPLLTATAELMALKPQVSKSSCSHVPSFKKKWALPLRPSVRRNARCGTQAQGETHGMSEAEETWQSPGHFADELGEAWLQNLAPKPPSQWTGWGPQFSDSGALYLPCTSQRCLPKKKTLAGTHTDWNL